ncbi:cytochrome P450 [Rhodocollybia butyracea]|uniref:Cytochrome P450 n=1 Tax=Rhodocollybia butyracea TaxID=206335 RepID=A0A9P5TV84_9AGAR|nr:cytochrome P450 [Rhodocollybia butyracea]
MESAARIIAAICASLIFLSWFRHLTAASKRPPLPPGPKKLPFIGNLLDLPRCAPWVTFAKWAEQFDSDIIHYEVAGSHYIVLNSYEAATDLLDKKSLIYSSRPHATMLEDLVGWKGDMVLMSYGNHLKAHRRLLHQEFHPFNSSLHRPHEKKNLRVFMNRMLDKPSQWEEHIRHLLGSTILAIAYGLNAQAHDDPDITAAQNMTDVFTATLVPGAFLVDIFPFLKYVPSWFPGASFQQQAKAWNGIREASIAPPFMRVKSAMLQGTSTEDSFSLRCLQNAINPDPRPDHLSEEEQIIKETAGTMFEGGADTALTALSTFILAMLCFPGTQTTAQEELDRVVGDQDLPDYEDQDSLPYITAIMYECFRWQTVTPLVVPHRVETEDTYKGYYIPANTTVLPNVWAILRDPKTYGPDAHLFNPNRWLLKNDSGEGSQWKLNTTMRSPLGLSFGFSRRVCPGKHMAISLFYITVASLLHCFNITPAIDKNGKEITPTVEYVATLQNRPAPFTCSIKHRSAKHKAMIKEMITGDSEPEQMSNKS